jgi:hypothetical protein
MSNSLEKLMNESATNTNKIVKKLAENIKLKNDGKFNDVEAEQAIVAAFGATTKMQDYIKQIINLVKNKIEENKNAPKKVKPPGGNKTGPQPDSTQPNPQPNPIPIAAKSAAMRWRRSLGKKKKVEITPVSRSETEGGGVGVGGVGVGASGGGGVGVGGVGVGASGAATLERGETQPGIVGEGGNVRSVAAAGMAAMAPWKFGRKATTTITKNNN